MQVGGRNYATFGPRFIGHLIDFVLVAVVTSIVGQIEQGIYGVSIIGNLGGIAYIWYFTSQGQTIGQQAMGLRIIDEAGNPPGPTRGIIRPLASIPEYDPDLPRILLGALAAGAAHLARHPRRHVGHQGMSARALRTSSEV